MPPPLLIVILTSSAWALSCIKREVWEFRHSGQCHTVLHLFIWLLISSHPHAESVECSSAAVVATKLYVVF